MRTEAGREGLPEKALMARLIASVQSNYEFLHGDWSRITDDIVAQGVKFDLIVSAETLYSTANYSKLYKTFLNLLRKPRGRTLIATKSYYFGVGGGTGSFIDFVSTEKDKAQGGPGEDDALDQIPLTKKQKVALSNPLKLNVQVVADVEAPLLRHILELKWQ